MQYFYWQIFFTNLALIFFSKKIGIKGRGRSRISGKGKITMWGFALLILIFISISQISHEKEIIWSH